MNKYRIDADKDILKLYDQSGVLVAQALKRVGEGKKVVVRISCLVAEWPDVLMIVKEYLEGR